MTRVFITHGFTSSVFHMVIQKIHSDIVAQLEADVCQSENTGLLELEKGQALSQAEVRGAGDGTENWVENGDTEVSDISEQVTESGIARKMSESPRDPGNVEYRMVCQCGAKNCRKYVF